MSMKKNFIWMFAAILTCGMAFTSCAKVDYPTGPEYYWEKTTNVIDFEDGTTPFTADSRITASVADDPTGLNGTKVATFKGAGNAQNGYSFAHYNFSDKVGKAKRTNISFDYFNANSRAIVTIGDALVRTNGVGAGCSKTTYGAKGGIFRIGSDKNNFFINGTNMTGGVGTWCNKWMKVELTIYNFDMKYDWKVTDIATGEILAECEDSEAFWQADANEATQIDVFGYINNGNNCYIDNLSITSNVDPDVKYTDVKVAYVDKDGNELKEARIVNGRVGAFVTILESDKAAIYAADNSKKWIYESDNAAETPIAENGVVKVVFREAAKYSIAINCYIEGTTTRITDLIRQEDVLFEGDTYYYRPKTGYVYSDGKCYFTPVSSYNGIAYAIPSTADKRTVGGKEYIFQTIYYAAVDTCLYFAECEDLETVGELGVPYSDKTFDRFSQGTAIQPLNEAYIVTGVVPAGTFDVMYYGRNDAGTDAKNDVLYILKADGTMEKVTVAPSTETWASAGIGWITFADVTIPEGAKLVIKNDCNNAAVSYDCIKVVKHKAAE